MRFTPQDLIFVFDDIPLVPLYYNIRMREKKYIMVIPTAKRRFIFAAREKEVYDI